MLTEVDWPIMHSSVMSIYVYHWILHIMQVLTQSSCLNVLEWDFRDFFSNDQILLKTKYVSIRLFSQTKLLRLCIAFKSLEVDELTGMYSSVSIYHGRFHHMQVLTHSSSLHVLKWDFRWLQMIRSCSTLSMISIRLSSQTKLLRLCIASKSSILIISCMVILYTGCWSVRISRDKGNIFHDRYHHQIKGSSLCCHHNWQYSHKLSRLEG